MTKSFCAKDSDNYFYQIYGASTVEEARQFLDEDQELYSYTKFSSREDLLDYKAATDCGGVYARILIDDNEFIYVYEDNLVKEES